MSLLWRCLILRCASCQPSHFLRQGHRSRRPEGFDRSPSPDDPSLALGLAVFAIGLSQDVGRARAVSRIPAYHRTSYDLQVLRPFSTQ